MEKEETYLIGNYELTKIDYYYMIFQRLLIESEKNGIIIPKVIYNDGFRYKGRVE